ncbi:RNA-directed DNA polymerase [Frateuria sp. MAH-13]|uniref:RNA-directed DNA polymerase n=1 Tax=Frateuria flava TaxID=2821489 RepID=A0ABS4DNC4_9GAMM|nr:antiviral reverse transcriptase Drt3b [Frateuria flava]MBP1474550.1 RNA-directed DNA polymerase [Frateuria flava]
MLGAVMPKKIPIDRTNSLRAILTDTLPYELPLFFTNEKLYVEATGKFQGLPSLVSTLLNPKGATKPIIYQVQKGGGSFRKITVLHPGAQLKLAGFYGEFDSFIESACARSTYSLRYPSRVGSHYFQKQYLESEETDNELPETEIDPVSLLPQRKWASSYFSYRRYSQIYKFFSSDEFTQLEQKYKFMLKTDIARCFESIYTHSIAWAVRGKNFGKEHRGRIFFEAEFDRYMRDANWGETGGIPIGPEVSRIFAEIVLQSVDLAIERSLGAVSQQVVIRRYVDDYFVFGDSEDTLHRVKAVIEKCASDYNLHLNERKTEIIRRPLISKLSVARSQTMSAISSFMLKARNSLDELQTTYFSVRDIDNIVLQIRHIAKVHDTDYSALASPALAVIGRDLTRIRRRIDSQSFRLPRQGSIVIEAILRLSAFLYQMDIRATTTHKLAKVLYEASLFITKIDASRSTFEAQVQDIVRSSLGISSKSSIHGPEIINLLVAADAVCSSTRTISPTMLELGIGQSFSVSDNLSRLNYFDLVSSLYFSKGFSSFAHIRHPVCEEIERRIEGLGNRLHSGSTETMLFFDYVSCPYVDAARRQDTFQKTCKSYGISVNAHTAIAQANLVGERLHFVTWAGSSQLRSLLERRELQPAYDS